MRNETVEVRMFDARIRPPRWAYRVDQLEFVERERTPGFAIQESIHLHLAGVSLSNTKQYLDILGGERSRTTIHNWVQNADRQPDSDADPNQIAVDETMIRVTGQRHWLYAAVDPDSNQFLHSELFQTRTTQFTVLFLRGLREKQQVDDVPFLVDDATHLKTVLDRRGLRIQVCRNENRNSVERVCREVKRRTSSFSNTFANAKLTTAESWLQAFAVWWNRCQREYDPSDLTVFQSAIGGEPTSVRMWGIQVKYCQGGMIRQDVGSPI